MDSQITNSRETVEETTAQPVRRLTLDALDTVTAGKGGGGGGGGSYWHHEYEVGGIYSSQTFYT
jgi:hypothetical protein